MYWLVSAAGGPSPTDVLWCANSDAWDQILKIDDRDVSWLADGEIAAYTSGARGWPVRLEVRSKSGEMRTIDCFASHKGG
jgi:hypothetical protein